MDSVQIHICGRICAVNFQKVPLPSRKFCSLDILGIAAFSTEIIVATILPIYAIPGVRKSTSCVLSMKAFCFSSIFLPKCQSVLISNNILMIASLAGFAYCGYNHNEEHYDTELSTISINQIPNLYYLRAIFLINLQT